MRLERAWDDDVAALDRLQELIAARHGAVRNECRL